MVATSICSISLFLGLSLEFVPPQSTIFLTNFNHIIQTLNNSLTRSHVYGKYCYTRPFFPLYFKPNPLNFHFKSIWIIACIFILLSMLGYPRISKVYITRPQSYWLPILEHLTWEYIIAYTSGLNHCPSVFTLKSILYYVETKPDSTYDNSLLLPWPTFSLLSQEEREVNNNQPITAMAF